MQICFKVGELQTGYVHSGSRLNIRQECEDLCIGTCEVRRSRNRYFILKPPLPLPLIDPFINPSKEVVGESLGDLNRLPKATSAKIACYLKDGRIVTETRVETMESVAWMGDTTKDEPIVRNHSRCIFILLAILYRAVQVKNRPV